MGSLEGLEGEMDGQQGFAVNVIEDSVGDGEGCKWLWQRYRDNSEESVYAEMNAVARR